MLRELEMSGIRGRRMLKIVGRNKMSSIMQKKLYNFARLHKIDVPPHTYIYDNFWFV